MSQPQLDYEPRRPPRLRFMSVLLLFLQFNAAVMMVLTCVMFWRTFGLAFGRSGVQAFVSNFEEAWKIMEYCLRFITPFTLSAILFVLCGRYGREWKGKHHEDQKGVRFTSGWRGPLIRRMVAGFGSGRADASSGSAAERTG